MNCIQLIDQLEQQHTLSSQELKTLLEHCDPAVSGYAAKKARTVADRIYGKTIFPRGLIEFTNFCANDCFYCGIRRSSKDIHRYRLSKETILHTCHHGYALGFRSFVLQGGEDPFFTDDIMTDIVYEIRNHFPDCAITLSIGERSKKSYQSFFDAGADRYLLRHETADPRHYKMLHPDSMSLEHRKECLFWLKEIGYAVGTGFMVGSPYQTNDHLVMDFEFISKLQPQMIGIGPFLPHHSTPLKNAQPGSAEKTAFLLSLLRLYHPLALLPATTSLGSASSNGRELGILAGANVVMPNLSPPALRKDYALYDHKLYSGKEDADAIHSLEKSFLDLGFSMEFSRGDPKKQ